MSLSFCERADNFRGDVKEEDGGDEREGQHEDDEGVTARSCQHHGPSKSNRSIGGGCQECSIAKEEKTHTRSPGESSVYNLSMVLEDPPAPAARVEFGRAA